MAHFDTMSGYSWPAMTPEALEWYRRYFPTDPAPAAAPAPVPAPRLGNGVDCPHCEHGTRGETWRCTVCNRVIPFVGQTGDGKP